MQMDILQQAAVHLWFNREGLTCNVCAAGTYLHLRAAARKFRRQNKQKSPTNLAKLGRFHLSFSLRGFY